MASIQNFMKIQVDLLQKVEKAHINFKKSPKERITVGYCQGRLEALEAYWTDFKSTHEKLILNATEEDTKTLVYFTENVFESLEERYYIYKGDLKNVLLILNTKHTDQPQSQVSQPNKSSCNGLKLPRIEIPSFSGNYTEWQAFHDLFTALIDTNSSLQNVQKLHYLKTSLKGDAEVLLRQFSITEDNYDEAWSVLKRRYDNKRYIANSIFKKFFGQKALVQESAAGLKQLLDTSVECMNALKLLGLPTTHWDTIINHVIVSKLDTGSHKHWEQQISEDEANHFPTFEQLQSFLETRFQTLEMVEPVCKSYKPPYSKTFHVTANNVNGELQCAFCKENHYIFNCKQFTKQSVEDRYNFVKSKDLCFNCLIPTHKIFHCKQKTSCQVCGRRHHSLLHRDSQQSEDKEANKTVQTNKEVTKVVAHVRSSEEEEESHNILLATALVGIKSRSGEIHVCRALLDQGSEASFVTAQLAELLKLDKTAISGTVSGLGDGNNVCINQMVGLQIMSRYETDFSVKVNAYVLKSLTRRLPSREIKGCLWPQLDSMKLADPTFNKPGKIDVLLGADIFGKIIDSGFMKGPGDVVAQHTHLGWILSGDTKTNSSNSQQIITSFHITRDVQEDNNLLKKFWEIETDLFTSKKTWSKEEEECEEVYKRTTTRDDTGRYVVHLPLKQNIEDTVKLCGETKQQALLRFKQLERKFDKNEKLKQEYKKVIHEYLELGHLKKVEDEEQERRAVFLAHHAIVREDRDTTKVRVVFDASAKGSNSTSLNNAMMVGPTIQPSLRSIIIRWRAHKFCVIGDIVKMYRQIKITEEHTDLQRIMWREEPSEKIESYKLLTVTFGTASAPFLAVRTLNQLADDEAQTYPRAAPAVKGCFYMDDLMSGHEDETEIKTLCHEINSMLKAGGFVMQKWSSNSESLLEFLQGGRVLQEPENKIEIKFDKVIKILGLTWDRKEDVFKITVNLPESRAPVTKRLIVSEVASLFDPFGWLAPVVITAKVMIQRLWLCSLGWDDELPMDLVEEWMTYRRELLELQTIDIPRWIRMTSRCKDVQLHGFADASSVAYAAVAYLRVVDENDIVHVTILAAKTKVAPLKQLTIPRLELCGAVLAAKLLRELSELLNIPMNSIYAWTDSMVVLSWLQSQPSRWQVFVGNRVSEIIQQIDNDRWRHVQSADNPADLASRGVNARDMANSDIWWNGPDWLRNKNIEFTRKIIIGTELESKKTFHVSVNETPIWERFSSMSRLKRVLALCNRFLHYKDKTNRGEVIKTQEINDIEERCIRYYQTIVYGKEIEDLEKKGKVSNRSSLLCLNPFLDKRNGLLRVGGRLNKANISENEKHPIIIPGKQHITRLIISEAHTRTLHGDIQLMMSYIRTKYWIISLKAAVRKVTRNCKTCIKDKARVNQQLMGQLPEQRVSPQRPFFNSGVDYAGPVHLRTSKGRGHKSIKGYICLFVCMSTHAIHLEAVTDLTTQAFIAAFRRFVSRRGHCAHLWSDHGSNFIGADKELKQMFAQSKQLAKEIAELLANDGTTWHFIPPRAPNFGGIWEAGVRSAKKHLTRVNGSIKLTYEEMATLLSQIEACLNSRPLCRLNEKLDTLDPLTPGHFLIGEPLINVPGINYLHRNVNLLTRWQLIQNRIQDFWKRWKSEYLNTLQQRYKWQETVKAPSIGDIVIVKEDDLPPAKWLLGRVTDLHPGSDHLVRVVTIRVKGNNLMKRPLSKVILLPIHPEA